MRRTAMKVCIGFDIKQVSYPPEWAANAALVHERPINSDTYAPIR